MKRTILAILDLLERSGVCYCVLHGWEQLGSETTSDVDLAVRPQDLGLVEELLFGQKEALCVQLLQHESSGYYFVLAAGSAPGSRFVRLDLATDYRRDGRLFLRSAELLSGRRLVENIWVSSPAVEFSYLLVKKVLKSTAQLSQRQRLRLLAEQLGTVADTIVARFFGRRRAPQLLSWLRQEEWSLLEQNLPRLKMRLRRVALRRDPSAWFQYWPPELRRLWRRWRRPAGLFLAVLGPDGSGKSTLIRRLPSILGQAFRRSDTFHLRPQVLPAAGSGGRTDDPHGKPPRSRLVSSLKLLYLFLDYCLGYQLRVRPRLTRSSLVLFDRYFPDLFADPLRYRHGGPLWLLRLAGRLVPRPDLVLVLDVPVTRLRERKQEVSLAEAGRQRAAYRELAAELPNAVLVAGGETETGVVAEAAEAILSFLRWRYGRRRKVWFPSSRVAGWKWLSEVLCAGASRSEGRPAGIRSHRPAFWRLSLEDGRGFAFPLAPPRTAAAALRMYGAQSLKARAAKCALTAGLAAGLFQPFLPRLESDLGGAGGGAFLAGYLKEILGRRDLDFAISLGTPGAHRKPVIQVLEAGGMALAYAKIGWNEATCELVGNEAEVLRRMAGADLPGLSLPNLLHQGRWQGRLVCLQSPAPRGATRAGRDLDSGYLGALHDLAAIESRPLPLGESPFWASLRRWVGLLPGAGYGGGLSALLERVPRRLREEQLPCRFCHGDFVPWNALRFNGRPFLFDWEYARWQWLPGYDLFHFLFQSRLLLTREPPASIFRDVLAQATTSEALRLYWRRLEIPEPSLRPLMLLYLLERAVRLAVENPEHYPALRRVLALLELGCAELGWLP